MTPNNGLQKIGKEEGAVQVCSWHLFTFTGTIYKVIFSLISLAAVFQIKVKHNILYCPFVVHTNLFFCLKKLSP